MDNRNDLRQVRSVVSKLNVHLVFVTKYRQTRFTETMLNDLKTWAEVICEKMEAQLIELNGEKDHIHLLVEYPPKLSVSQLVNSLKGVTARRFNQKYQTHLDGKSFWSPSYFAISCGGAPLAVIQKYIENQ